MRCRFPFQKELIGKMSGGKDVLEMAGTRRRKRPKGL